MQTKLTCQIFSDMHLESGINLWKFVTPQAPIAIVAGDIDSHDFADSLNIIAEKFEQVIAVPGNHDFYHNDINWMKSTNIDLVPNVKLLDRSHFEYNGALFIGATLWSDLKNGDPLCYNAAYRGINDFRVIRVGEDEIFTPQHMIELHNKDAAYLKTMLQLNRDKKVVVVTHFMPSTRLVNPKWGDCNVNLLNNYFAADCTDLVENSDAALWVCGHTHDAADVMIGNTRVVINPLGYPKENPHYADLIVEI